MYDIIAWLTPSVQTSEAVRKYGLGAPPMRRKRPAESASEVMKKEMKPSNPVSPRIPAAVPLRMATKTRLRARVGQGGGE